MKVLLLTDADVFAGTERHMAELAGELRRAGANVLMGCPVPSPLADQANASAIDVLPIGKRGPIDRRAIRAIAAFLRGGDDRIVHCHNGRVVLQAAIARSVARRGTVVLTQHFLSPSYATRRGWRRAVSDRLHAFVDRRTDHVIAISDAVRDGVLARGEATADAVTRVHNGMAASQTVDRDRVAAIRAALGATDGVPLIISAARLESEKRVSVLVTAMADVVHDANRTQCVIAGEGKDRNAIQSQIDRLGLSASVSLLGFREDVREVIAAADVFVLPADAEPFGLVVLEAMAAGVPVIATDAGGPREIVVPGETGWLVRPNDPAALAEAINDALSDPERARRFGLAGRARLETHFSAERMARETIAVYERALAQRPAR